jgi:hypothetical protein
VLVLAAFGGMQSMPLAAVTAQPTQELIARAKTQETVEIPKMNVTVDALFVDDVSPPLAQVDEELPVDETPSEEILEENEVPSPDQNENAEAPAEEVTAEDAETTEDTKAVEEITEETAEEAIESQFAGGDGTQLNPYQIETREQLAAIGSESALLGNYYVLRADIDLAGTDWQSISGFSGSLDGENHFIYGLSGASGLFSSTTATSSIKNLHLRGVSLAKTDSNLGALVNESRGAVQDVTVEGEVRGAATVGGLVGHQISGVIRNCDVQVSVSGTQNVGGLVGLSQSDIENSNVHDAQITGVSRVGGLIGSKTAGNVIAGSAVSVALVASGNSVGGLIGEATGSGNVTRAYSSGTLLVTGAVQGIGGLIGQSQMALSDSYSTVEVSAAQSSAVGGLVGSQTSQAITRCYARGNVYGATAVGGLVGRSTVSITNAYVASQEVQGSTQVGGILGRADAELTVSQTYVTAHVSGTNWVAGIVGSIASKASIRANFFVGDIDWAANGGVIASQNSAVTGNDMLSNYRWSGIRVNGSLLTGGQANMNGTSTTADYLQLMSSYLSAGWNFNGIWIWDAADQFPKLGIGEESNPFPFERPAHGRPATRVYAAEHTLSLDELFSFAEQYPTDSAHFELVTESGTQTLTLLDGALIFPKLAVGSYQISYFEGTREWAQATLEITPKTVTWSAGAVADKSYDGSADALAHISVEPQLIGVLEADSAAISRGTLVFSQADAGVNLQLTAANWGLTGSDAGNYVLGQPEFGVASILPREITALDQLTIETGHVRKIYDGLTDIDLESEKVNHSLPLVHFSAAGLQLRIAFDTRNFTALEFLSADVGTDKDVRVRDLSFGANFTVADEVYAALETGTRLFNGAISEQFIDDINKIDYDSGFLSKVYDGLKTAQKADAMTGASATIEPIDGEKVWVVYQNVAFDTPDVGGSRENPRDVAILDFQMAGANIVFSPEVLAHLASTLYTGEITPKRVDAWSDLGNVTPGEIARTYDGTTLVAADNVLSLPQIELSATREKVAVTTGTLTFDAKNAGTRTVTFDPESLAFTGLSNYTLTDTFKSTQNLTALFDASISRRDVWWENGSVDDKEYDGTTDAAVRAQPRLTNLVAADGITYDFKNVAFAEAAPGLHRIFFEHTLDFSDEVWENYTRLNEPEFDDARIRRKVITSLDEVTFTRGQIETRDYDGTTNARVSKHPKVTIDGMEIELTDIEVAFENGDAGENKALKIGEIKSDALAYFDISQIEAEFRENLFETATITPRALDWTDGSVADKVYDRTTDAQIVTAPALTGILAADDVSVGAGNAHFASNQAGMHAITADGWHLSGADARNYTLLDDAQPEFADATITPRALTFDGAISAEKHFDGQADFLWEQVTLDGALTGILEPDEVVLDAQNHAISHTNPGDMPNHHVGTSVLENPDFILTGNDSPNYQLTQPQVATTILQAPVNLMLTETAISANHIEVLALHDWLARPVSPALLSTRLGVTEAPEAIQFAISETPDPQALTADSWQDAPRFTDLSAQTTYYVFAKSAETHNFEGAEAVLELTTLSADADKAPENGKTPDINAPENGKTPDTNAPDTNGPNQPDHSGNLPSLGDAIGLAAATGFALIGFAIVRLWRSRRKKD